MMKYVSRRILLLTALYVCIIFGIFALQFTNGNAFSLSIGSLMVSGTMVTDDSGPSRPDLPLHIGSNGLDFFLDAQNSLMAYTSEKTAVALKVTAVSHDLSRLTLLFTEGVSVSFSSEKRGDADIITVRSTMPEKYLKVAFPYKIARSSHIEKKDSLTLVNTGKKLFAFSGASVEPVSGNAVRSLSMLRVSPVVYYQTYLPAKGLSIEELAALPAATGAAYTRSVEQFASNALITFKEAVVAGSFSEPLVASYIAEMGRIGMYRAAIESIPDSYRNGPGRTWQTATFLDNLEKTYAGLMSKEREDRTELSRKLTENNPACFEFPSLVPYLVDRGSTVSLKDIARIASTVDMAAITPLQASGILESMMDFSVYAPAEENPLLPLSDSCERKLKASLVRINDELYISGDAKTVNTLDTLQIAAVLIRYGSTGDGKEAWASVGHLLVTSMISFAGEKAGLPAQFVFAGGDGSGEKTGVVAQPEQILNAARLYPVVVTDNSWYPHALSLSAQAGPGVWAWTSAQSVKIVKTADGVMTITARFPQGETHYMVLRGIKPFSRILIYGLDFHTDPRFESYNSSGYVYNEQTGTLYLKMRHKNEYEDVVIYPGPATGTGSAPAADGAGDGASNDAAPETGTTSGN